MSVTDAERAFYESVVADPEGKSIQDLRYAYFLAAVDGGLPVPDLGPSLEAVAGYDAGVAQTLTHDATGVLTWVASA